MLLLPSVCNIARELHEEKSLDEREKKKVNKVENLFAFKKIVNYVSLALHIRKCFFQLHFYPFYAP